MPADKHEQRHHHPRSPVAQGNTEFLFVAPPTISVETYQAVYCQRRHGRVSDACPYAPEMYQMLLDAGIDPVIELAFAAKETEFGTTGPGRAPQHNVHNIVCNQWDGGTCQGPYHHRFSTYPNYLHATQAWIQLMLYRGRYVDAGRTTFRQVLPIYAPSFENDTARYINQAETWVRGWRAWEGVQEFPMNPMVRGAGIRMPPPPVLGDPRISFETQAGVRKPVINKPAPVLDAPVLPEEATMVDNSDPGFSANQATWRPEPCGVHGEHVATDSTSVVRQSASRASWVPVLPSPGVYEVRVYIPGCGDTNEATQSVSYVVTHDGGVETTIVNQQEHVGEWVSLGTYFFGSRFNPMVEISDLTGDDNRAVRVDMAAWIPSTDTAPPAASISRLVWQRAGYAVAWQGSDDVSGIASYDVQVWRVSAPGWQNWLETTTRTDAVLEFPLSGLVAFRVRARDRAGMEGPWSQAITIAQATPFCETSGQPCLEPVAAEHPFSGVPEHNASVPHVPIPETPTPRPDGLRGGVVVQDGNLRQEPHLIPDTITGQVCAGDEVVIVAEEVLDEHAWMYVRIERVASECAPNHVTVGMEGWVSQAVVSGY